MMKSVVLCVILCLSVALAVTNEVCATHNGGTCGSCLMDQGCTFCSKYSGTPTCTNATSASAANCTFRTSDNGDNWVSFIILKFT